MKKDFELVFAVSRPLPNICRERRIYSPLNQIIARANNTLAFFLKIDVKYKKCDDGVEKRVEIVEFALRAARTINL